MKFTCQTCGGTFDRAPKHAARVKRLFCSIVCRGKAERGENNPYYRGVTVRHCKACGVEMKLVPSAAKRIYCSIKCRAVTLRGPDSPRYSQVEQVCPQCSATFMLRKGATEDGTTRFCSRTCANRWHRQAIAGANNPRYIDGRYPEKYPAAFEELKPAVRERDGAQCRKCGSTYRLHVHHIDFETSNNSLGNLILICQACHRKAHSRNAEPFRHVLLSLLIQ